MSDSTEIILHPGHPRTPARRRRTEDRIGPSPAVVAAAGAGAEFAWDEFFKGQRANAHARKNDAHAVRHFLARCNRPDRQVPLIRIAPDHVGVYLAGLQLATPTPSWRSRDRRGRAALWRPITGTPPATTLHAIRSEISLTLPDCRY